MKGSTEELEMEPAQNSIRSHIQLIKEVLLRLSMKRKAQKKKQHVNKWDCHPNSQQFFDPNRTRKLRETLVMINKLRLMYVLQLLKRQKVAHEKKCMYAVMEHLVFYKF